MIMRVYNKENWGGPFYNFKLKLNLEVPKFKDVVIINN